MLIISKNSTDKINTKLSNLVNENINKQLDKLTPMEKKFIKENIKKSEIEKLYEFYSLESDTKKVNNYFIYSSIKITMIILIVIFILIVAASKLLCHKLPLKHILIENIIIFSGIGIIHFLLFKFIILKYIPVEPSFITTYLLEIIKKHFA